MVSLILQEAREFCCERGGALNVCYMGAKSAFDMVWIDRLLYKLHNMGVGGKTLIVIVNSLKGSSSRILQNGYLSEFFHIKQGTRQGSICAPFFYTVYINDLLVKLQESQHGIRIFVSATFALVPRLSPMI